MPDGVAEEGVAKPDIGDVRIQDVVGVKEQTALERLLASQPFCSCHRGQKRRSAGRVRGVACRSNDVHGRKTDRWG